MKRLSESTGGVGDPSATGAGDGGGARATLDGIFDEPLKKKKKKQV